MLRFIAIAAAIVSLAAPFSADAHPRHYGFSISASATDPFVNNPPNPGFGIQVLYLWTLDTCNPTGGTPPGLHAAEFKIRSTEWLFLAPTFRLPFYDAGSPAIDGHNFLLALGGCPDRRRIISELLVLAYDVPGRLDFAPTDPLPGMLETIAAVDCSASPRLWEWPEFVRVVGYATQDAGVNQDSGESCDTPVSVEGTSWGRVKALYR